MRCIVVGGVIFCTSVISAESQVVTYTAGSAEVDGTIIQPYRNEWRVVSRALDGTETPAGRWTDSVDIILSGGDEVLRRTQIAYDAEDNVVSRQVHLVNRSTMAPVASHLVAGERIKHFDYNADGVSGFLLLNSHTRAILLNAQARPAAFDWEIAGVLLVAFQMQVGDEIRFPYFDFTPADIGDDGTPGRIQAETRWLTAVAQATEQIESEALGNVEALRVQTRQGNRTLTFWLTNSAPYILKLRSESPQGTTIWTIPDRLASPQ